MFQCAIQPQPCYHAPVVSQPPFPTQNNSYVCHRCPSPPVAHSYLQVLICKQGDSFLDSQCGMFAPSKNQHLSSEGAASTEGLYAPWVGPIGRFASQRTLQTCKLPVLAAVFNDVSKTLLGIAQQCTYLDLTSDATDVDVLEAWSPDRLCSYVLEIQKMLLVRCCLLWLTDNPKPTKAGCGLSRLRPDQKGRAVASQPARGAPVFNPLFHQAFFHLIGFSLEQFQNTPCRSTWAQLVWWISTEKSSTLGKSMSAALPEGPIDDPA